MIRPRGVVIFVPAYGQQVCAKTMQSVYETGKFLTQNSIPNELLWFSAADIEDVRNLILTAWYDTMPNFSHLLMVDADMGFHPFLIGDMLKFDKPLTGVLYAKRQAKSPEVVGSLPKGHSAKDIVNGFMKTLGGVGAGVLMIQRKTISEMLKKMPEIIDDLPSVLNTGDFDLKRLIRAFDKIRDGNTRLSEDKSFCERWHRCGGEVWANVDHMISHVGPFDFSLRYGAVLRMKEQAENEDKREEAA